MFSSKPEFINFIDLLTRLTEKELRTRYKYTIFGFFWLVANPLLQMLTIGFVFTFFMKEPVSNYNLFLFIGLLLWNFFSLSLTKTTPCIVNERSLIKKSKFPHSVIPLSIIMSNFIHLLSAFVILLIPITFLGTFSAGKIVYIVLGFFLLISFTVGLSLFTSALNVKYRDVNFFAQALLIIWFYATPIIYPLAIIPYKFYWLWRLNPLTSVFQFFQHALLDKPLPGIGMITMNIVVIAVSLTLGVYVFQKESKNFDDWI